MRRSQDKRELLAVIFGSFTVSGGRYTAALVSKPQT